MQLTPYEIEDLKRDYRTMTSSQMAKKRGVSDEVMRKALSQHGIHDPKKMDPDKFQRLVVGMRIVKGWKIRDIAEQMECHVVRVRRALRKFDPRLVRPGFQLWTWTPKDVVAEPAPHPPMRIVHMASKPDCVQLSIAFQEFQQQIKAA